MVELNGEYAALSDIYPGENYIELYDDGSGVIAFSGSEDDITWSKTDNGYAIVVQGMRCDAVKQGDSIVLELDGAYVTYVLEGTPAPEIPTMQAPDYDTDISSPYGTYYGTMAHISGERLDMTEFYQGECSIFLDTDGMGSLLLGGSEIIIAWELDGQMLIIADTNGVISSGTLSNGSIELNHMETGLWLSFEKKGAN